MKRFAWMLLVVMVVTVFSSDAEARLFGRRRARVVPTGAGYNLNYQIDTKKVHYNNTMSLQDIAMMRAQWMAHTYNLDHNIHDYTAKCPRWQHPGCSGEGIGMSGHTDYKDCGTCIVGQTVVADGWARAKNGQVYRVRLFR